MSRRPFAVDHALGLQPRRISRANAGLVFDDLVHQRLRETGLIALVMTKAAVAPHVDHDVAVEFLAELDCHFAGESHGFGIVAINVEYRCLHALCHVRWIRRAAGKLRAGGKSNLIVDDEMDAAASIISAYSGKSEALPYDTLAGKGRIAV